MIGGKLNPTELTKHETILERTELETGLIREVKQEVGLDVTRIGGFDIVEKRVMYDIGPSAFFICYAALIDTAPGDIVLNPTEHDELRWVDTTQPLTDDMTTATTKAIGLYNRFALGL